LLGVAVTLLKDRRDRNAYICEWSFIRCYLGSVHHDPSNLICRHFRSANSGGSSQWSRQP
jgi:hypothetical protein